VDAAFFLNLNIEKIEEVQYFRMGYREFESNKSPPTPPGAPSKLFSLKGEIKKKINDILFGRIVFTCI
jgi:hypothetical protein